MRGGGGVGDLVGGEVGGALAEDAGKDGWGFVLTAG